MGNYHKTIKHLGEGGFGDVHLVKKENKIYALKKIKEKL